MRIAAELSGLRRDVLSLRANPANVRRHPEANLLAIEVSLRAHGQQKPIVVRDGVVIAGNGTLEAARRLGATEIACVEFAGTEAEARAFALADNRPGDLAEDDADALARTLRELEAAGLLETTGFDDAAFADALAAADALAGSVEAPESDRARSGADRAETALEVGSEVGGVYALGPHLVFCGDSTAPTPALLSALGSVTHVLADPPYGVGYECHLAPARGTPRGRALANDAPGTDTGELVRAALAPVSTAEAAFVFCDWRSLNAVRAGMEAAGLAPKTALVWRKTGGHQNLDRYARSHELILYAGPFGGEPTQGTDVWDFPREFGVDHPTPKPVTLLAHALTTAPRSRALADCVVYDPFAGSGSTLLACEAVGCRCVLVECDPTYVDLIRRRYTEYCRDRSPGA